MLLLDAAIDEKEVNKIKQIVEKQKLVTSYHYLKTRQVGNIKYVEIHLVFNPEILLVDAHRVGDHVEAKIAEIDTWHDWKILVHLDPYDDSME